MLEGPKRVNPSCSCDTHPPTHPPTTPTITHSHIQTHTNTLSLSLRLSDSVRVFCLTKGWISLASEGNVDRTANARSKALLEHRWIVDPSQCCRSRREVCVKKRTQEQRGVTLSRQEIASQPVL